jgi:hypothetical protein
MAKVDLILAVNNELISLMKSNKWESENYEIKYHEQSEENNSNWLEINNQGSDDYVRIEEIPIENVGWNEEELKIIGDIGSSLHAYNLRFWEPNIVYELLKWLPQKAHAIIDNDLGDLIDVSRIESKWHRDKLPMFRDINA